MSALRNYYARNLVRTPILPKKVREPKTAREPSPQTNLTEEEAKLERLKANDNSRFNRRARRAKALEDEKNIKPHDHCFHLDTAPPNDAELEYARNIFKVTRHSPNHLWCRSSFRDIPRSDFPEVVLMGRSNAGKSSLINALLGKKICNASPKPGRTQVLNGFGIGGTKGGESKVVLVDTPGYGYGSNAVSGPELMKYLSKRQQLRRIYLLINAKIGLKDSDRQMLGILRGYSVPYQIVFTRIDNMIVKFGRYDNFEFEKLKAFKERARDLIKEVQPPPQGGPPPLHDYISTSVRMTNPEISAPLGVGALQWSILQAAGLAQRIAMPGIEAERMVDSGGIAPFLAKKNDEL